LLVRLLIPSYLHGKISSLTLTEEQIFNLAPDDSSRKSGKDLANPAKWVSRGGNESALWGECQGSGSKPYQTQIDLSNIAFKCSCPSRKFPCKHGIGLLLYKVRQPTDFASTQMPSWVEDWISKRVNRQEKEAEKKDKPVDEAAQAKRQASREMKVGDGLDELLLWIKDIVRNGILNIPEKDSVWFENMARRMVDAQAPGMAGMVRNLGNISYFREGWQNTFMDQLAGIYLVISGYKNLAAVNDALQQDIRSWIGFTRNQEELKEQPGVTDTWLVLGKQTEEDDNLTVERYWMYGINSRRYALVLQFVFRGQGAQLTLTPGLFIQAELAFFPSSSPLRALIKNQVNTPAIIAVPGFDSWQGVLEQETTLAALQPFRHERPYIIQGLTPIHYRDGWWLQDKEQYLMPVKEGYSNIWKLLSLSGGTPMDMAVIGKEQYFEPVGIWYNSEYRPL
jgi:SWIM zinc finger